MPEYRVELASSARAGCQDTLCKKEGIKIPKGELRFGTWVELKGGEHGSWKWKHWGCVSGLQMLQAYELCDQNEDGELSFDFLDGYDDLVEHPDIQEKIRRCVAQQHIDPEDFKGDPDFNVPGKKGIRAPARRGKKADADASDNDAAPKTKAPAKKGKRSQKQGGDDEAEDSKPAKKKAKKADDDGSDGAAAKTKAPAKKGKRTLKQADDSEAEDAKPAKRAKTEVKAEVKGEDETEDELAKDAKAKVTKKGAPSAAKAKPNKRTKASPVSEDHVKSESEAEDGGEEEEPTPAAKKKATRGKAAKPAKAEPAIGGRRSQRTSKA